MRREQPATTEPRRMPEVNPDEITAAVAARLARVFASDLNHSYYPGADVDQVTAKASVVTAWATLALALQGEEL